jgi:hypothetical protein
MGRTGALALVLLMLTALAAGCSGAAAGVTPSASTTTAIQGWEYYFRLEWDAVEMAGGKQVGGYIYNNYGAAAGNVRILAQGVDGAGNLVGQRIAWVPGTVPALSRSYFTVAGLPEASQYRVSVWAWDFVQSPGMPER